MNIDKEQAIFLALADPTRRLLIKKLSVEGDKTATELARELPITRQGVMKHLKILRSGILVTVYKDGRDRRYSLAPSGLEEAVAWVTAVQQQWDKRLNALYDYLASEESDN